MGDQDGEIGFLPFPPSFGSAPAEPSSLYVFQRGSRKVAARATARTLVPCCTEPIRREQPHPLRAPILIGKHLGRTRAPAERPRPIPSGETAPWSASTGTGWGCGGSCVRVHDQQAPAWPPIRGTIGCTKNEDGLSVLTGHRKSSMSSHSAMPKATRSENASSPTAVPVSPT